LEGGREGGRGGGREEGGVRIWGREGGREVEEGVEVEWEGMLVPDLANKE